MSLLAPGLTAELSAQIFGTLALRMDAFAALAVRSELAVEKNESHPAGTILFVSEMEEALRGDFPSGTVSAFLSALASGNLHGHRHDLRDEGFRHSIVRKQDPVDPELIGPGPATPERNVRLTVPGVFLENVVRIPAAAFQEAVLRALGHRSAETMDLLWLHAGHGELRRYAVTEPIVLSAHPPPDVTARSYRESPSLFPLVCLQFDKSDWKIQPRHVIGRPDVRDRLLAVLHETPWNLQITPGQHRPRPRKEVVRETLVALIRQSAPPPPKEPEPPPSPPPKPPVPERPREVADVFFRRDAEIIRRGFPGIVGITEPSIPVEALSRVPGEFFERAVRWCLGVREPREGDRIVMTSGERFSKNGEIRDCVFVCPQIPESRKSSSYPKIGMEYRSGRWVVLRQSLRGHGHEDLLRAVTAVADWGIVQEADEEE